MGAIGLGQSDSAELQEISGQLAAINTQLNSIQQTLSEIHDILVQQDCNSELSQANDAVNAIKTADVRYQSFIKAAVDSGSVDEPGMVEWANNVLTGSNGIKEAMDAALISIADAMVGPAGTGILRSCLVHSIVPKPGAGTTNFFGTDADYYGYTQDSNGQVTVNDFISYYYGYQALGLMMLQEAYHVRGPKRRRRPHRPDP